MLEGGRYFLCSDIGMKKAKFCVDTETRRIWEQSGVRCIDVGCCWNCDTKCEFECGRIKPKITQDEYRPKPKGNPLRPGYHYRK